MQASASSMTKVNAGALRKGASTTTTLIQRRRVVAKAGKTLPSWYPGAAKPKYLDGSLPGDYGFDPLQLGTEPEQLKWFAQAELLHARFAMLGCLGVLAPEAAAKLGVQWPGAGVNFVDAATFQYDYDSKVYFVIQLFLMHWVEIRRYQDMQKEGSVNQDPIFQKYELPSDNKSGYPGGIFDLFGWSTRSSQDLEELKLKEIKNGRLAMFSFIGFWLQYNVQGKGPIECWGDHLANPFVNNILTTDAIPFIHS
ncbi:chloroplast chlorophyll a-b binding protein [Chloropicon primus]|uniref:Chlorophyll a-b binding protein, chloroplastic n=1 Tax=Chloropicon primus TaxID=1764295 RepID=A0A5B8MDS6_9CHLO|nr:chloroplast chlorophyll a-b binding protein [Chloropicon primus]UPQ97943.1 chloroplast chlorophyll a-b binding protein [Chloropicon primus]|mmetsp:Transcript_11145/g.31114  ORF Transcript_11145/g.31114 Transcript_11145/m.31114 type:complete len:253 (+) Transcript_11145:131-889(+)|eukprot:QDZ18736.1 chloroplast chlorophyll a-b binding protein [Chloropicon primus]